MSLYAASLSSASRYILNIEVYASFLTSDDLSSLVISSISYRYESPFPYSSSVRCISAIFSIRSAFLSISSALRYSSTALSYSPTAKNVSPFSTISSYVSTCVVVSGSFSLSCLSFITNITATTAIIKSSITPIATYCIIFLVFPLFSIGIPP